MSDYLAEINKIIEEHQAIRRHVKLVGESIGDQEALLSLQSARPDWIPGRLEILSEKQNKLTQTINFLSEGLKNHFAKEEMFLPPVLGEFLMRALILEHREIGKAIKEVRAMAANTKLEGLSREDLMSREAEIQQKVGNLCNLIEEHANKEELMLEMVQRALEEKALK
jgi:hemerythrin